MIMVCDLVNIVIARNWLLVVGYWFGLAKRQEQASGMFYQAGFATAKKVV